MNPNPLDSAIGFAMTYALDSDLSGDSAIHCLNNWGQINNSLGKISGYKHCFCYSNLPTTGEKDPLF